MNRRIIYKVPNGKLLRIFLNYNIEKNLILDLKITGDFFAYPEESIDILEKELLNIKIDSKILIEKISSIVEKYNIQFIGLNIESLVDAILLCVQ